MRQEDAISGGAAAARGLWDTVARVHGTVVYDPEGLILEINDVMLGWIDRQAEEVVGQHFGLLYPSPDPRAAWLKCRDGACRDLPRLASADGAARQLVSSLAPVLNADGSVSRLVQITTDITDQIQQDVEDAWSVRAIQRSHATITFSPDGLILDANQRFLDAMGYTLDEIVGRHHRTFVEPSYSHSAEYALFWRDLAQGRPQSGQYRRFTKGRAEVWLQAVYNPVLDPNGAVRKIVKLATFVTEEKLRQAEHQGQIAAIHNSLCVISFDLEGNICDANDNFLTNTGYRLSEIRGRHHSILVDQAFAVSEEYKVFWRNLAAGRHQSGEYKRIAKDGRDIWLQATYNPVLDLNGRPFRIVKLATVVTDQKLRHADVQGQLLAIGKSQGLIFFDLNGTILEANENFCRTVGYSAEELVGYNHRMLVGQEVAQSVEYAQFWETLRTGTFVSGLYRRIGKNGRPVWIQASYNPILDLTGKPSRIVKFATDVTSNIELAEAYEDAKRQSQHDPATALPNRLRLLSFMSNALSRPDRSLTLLYLDLDRFKAVNDTFGHQAGDHVLAQVADNLRRNLRCDQIAARIGGDEFVIAAPDLAQSDAEDLCSRIIEAVSAPILFNGNELRVGISIGIATSADADTPDELLRCADVAMYRSKQNGRGIYSFYAESLNDRLVEARALADDLQRGIAAREFFLEFQPRFSGATNRIVCAEALLRWRHPRRGVVPPATFIPAAERSGVIVALGEWVLREACRAAGTWPEIAVSVNVSPVQFQTKTFADLVETVTAETGLPPGRLELEITESVILADGDVAQNTLARLKQLGVRIAMDDFGTGYSSLSTLRSFPFDVIKIDRQFVRDIDTKDGGRQVVQAILGLADALGMSVTAEGVETPSQLSMLTSDHCAELQGYLLARPMPAAALKELLDRPENPVPLIETFPPRSSAIRRNLRKSRKPV